MSKPLLGILMNNGPTRLMLVNEEGEMARLTLSSNLEVEEVWSAAERVSAACQVEACLVIFVDAILCGPEASIFQDWPPVCLDDECTTEHSDCDLAQEQFGWLRARLQGVAPWV